MPKATKERDHSRFEDSVGGACDSERVLSPQMGGPTDLNKPGEDSGRFLLALTGHIHLHCENYGVYLQTLSIFTFAHLFHDLSLTLWTL